MDGEALYNFCSPKGIRTRYVFARSASGAPPLGRNRRAIPVTPTTRGSTSLALPPRQGVRPTILLPNVITRAHYTRVLPFGGPKGIRTPVSALRGPRPRPG